MQTNTPQAKAIKVMQYNAWVNGFNPQAELWNVCLVMLGFVSAIAIELFTYQIVLHFWSIFTSGTFP
jgi:hypothetical protein